jgi:enoyl-CoA hydratase/carnithine racemase
VIILTGGIKNFFVAGADISQIQKRQEEEREKTEKWIVEANELMNFIENGEKPVIVAINGVALGIHPKNKKKGGGLEVSMACNARVSLKTATLGLPELNIGKIKK